MDVITELVKRVLRIEDLLARKARRDINTSSRGLTIEVGASNELETRTTFHRIRPNADGASSNVDTIAIANDGLVVTFSPYAASKTLIFKDNTDNLRLAGDCTLDSPHDTITLVCDRANETWNEVSRSNNA